MTDQPITKAINNWRSAWRIDREYKQRYIEPTDDEAWEEYVNSLTMSEVLWNLEMYDEPE